MSGTYPVVMGDRRRLVIPAELREHMHLEAGSALLLLETPNGIILATREQELLEDRRKSAAGEDAA